jgi:hypothetical protein
VLRADVPAVEFLAAQGGIADGIQEFGEIVKDEGFAVMCSGPHSVYDLSEQFFMFKFGVIQITG